MAEVENLFTEEQLLPLSALQHLIFCERQCALIHIEQVWRENRLTIEGRHGHERVDHGQPETRGGLRVLRSLPVRSLRLGIVGKCDAVEVRQFADGSELWTPIEYKRGRPKRDQSDEVQLCAQAMCLEDMMGISITTGALYYVSRRERFEIELADQLRAVTEGACARLHRLIHRGIVPVVAREPKCKSCSLEPVCLPPKRVVSAEARFARSLEASLAVT
jgi:CRISPR-associated exonuclease Cas4